MVFLGSIASVLLSLAVAFTIQHLRGATADRPALPDRDRRN
jgi:hypothetical protein